MASIDIDDNESVISDITDISRSDQVIKKYSQEEVIDAVKKLVAVETKILELKKQLAVLNKKKKELTPIVGEIMDTNELDCVDSNKGKITRIHRNVKETLSKKNLSRLLTEYYEGNAEEATKTCDYVLNNRLSKVTDNIKFKPNGN